MNFYYLFPNIYYEKQLRDAKKGFRKILDREIIFVLKYCFQYLTQ